MISIVFLSFLSVVFDKLEPEPPESYGVTLFQGRILCRQFWLSLPGTLTRHMKGRTNEAKTTQTHRCENKLRDQESIPNMAHRTRQRKVDIVSLHRPAMSVGVSELEDST